MARVRSKTIKTAGESACPTKARDVVAKVGQAFSLPLEGQYSLAGGSACPTSLTSGSKAETIQYKNVF
jgi:hypothetical protein